MMTAAGRQLNVISFLLQYPGIPMLEEISDMGEIAGVFASETARCKMRAFLSYLASTPVLELQEDYTKVFDLDPKACLYFTYHRYGNDPNRAAELVRLQRLYFQDGYENASGELPDYLPLVLEFLSVCGAGCASEVIGLCHKEIFRLASRLREVNSPYAGLLEILSDLLDEMPAGDIGHG